MLDDRGRAQAPTRRSSRATRSSLPFEDGAFERALHRPLLRPPRGGRARALPRRGPPRRGRARRRRRVARRTRPSPTRSRSGSSTTARAGRSTSATSTPDELAAELGGGETLFAGDVVRRRACVTRRRSSYRSIASLQRDNRVCRACAEAGYPLESLPIVQPYRGQRAYMFGQAPGIQEGLERLPWRGRAGKTLRRWLELDEDDVLRDVLLRVGHALLPGPRAERPRRPDADATRAGALLVLARVGVRAGPSAADRHGRRTCGAPPARREEHHRVRRRPLRARATRSRSRCRTRPARPAG